MTLHELESPTALQSFISSNKNAVICFSATWCGPCKRSKPDLEEMASQYAADVTKNVAFGIVYEHVLGDAIHTYGVKAFPTYILFQNGREVERVQGVNMNGIRVMIEAAGCNADLTGGETLGGGATPLSPAEARAQRLAKLGAITAPADAPAKEEKSPAEDVEMNTEEKTNNEDIEMKDAADTDNKAEASSEDPTAKLDEALLQTLTESMGFPLLRAQKGLLYGNAQTIDGAVDWIMQHQDDDDIDEPIPLGPVVKAQSYKCNECGKIMSNIANLETHANKTGHSDFEESTQAVKPLTEEEKAAKVKEIKALLAIKRAQREELEKAEEKERERQRRLMGKEMSKTREQMEMEQRKRDAQQRKREKEAARRERERIRAELAKDKAERRANKGKLQSTLGVEGYNPSAIQYDNAAGVEGQAADADHEEHRHKKIQASSAKIDEYIQKVSQYRAGGDGGKCLKILSVYVSNVVDNPGEEKYRTINMENKVFRTKVKPFIGGKHLLVAVGFKENEGGTALVLKEDADPKLLADTKDKLNAALEAY